MTLKQGLLSKACITSVGPNVNLPLASERDSLSLSHQLRREHPPKLNRTSTLENTMQASTAVKTMEGSSSL